MSRALILFTIILLIDLKMSFGQTWNDVAGGLNGAVYSMASYNGELYVGGAFTMAGTTAVNHIARWNGTSWTALGNGTDGLVRCLIVYKNKLYVGGAFSYVDSVVRLNLAKWDGNSWSGVPLELDGTVNCFEEYNNKLYIGGNFWHLGASNTVGHVVAWDESNWFQLYVGLNGNVVSLVTSGDKLYAGGSFTLEASGGKILDRIASWNDTSWSPVGGGFDAGVSSLAMYNGTLYAGGAFNNSGLGGGSVYHVSKWDSTVWGRLPGTSPGYGVNAAVLAMCSYGGNLYLGGQFTYLGIGGYELNHIATWDGNYLKSYGIGMDNEIYCFAIYNNELYAGGAFLTADSQSVYHIARLSAPTGIGPTLQTIPERFALAQNFPNPFNPVTTIRYSLPSNMNVRLIVYNMLGEEVATLVNHYQRAGNQNVEFETGYLPSGVYFYELTAGTFKEIKKMILLR